MAAKVWSIYLAAFVASAICGSVIAKSVSLAVYYENGERRIRETSLVPENYPYAAMAVFQDNGNVTGWGVLDVQLGNGDGVSGTAYVKDTVQMNCAGLVEGTVTALRIEETFTNIKAYYGPGSSSFPSPAVTNFLLAQYNYTKSHCQGEPSTKFWKYTCLLASQFDGLAEGYAISMNLDLDESRLRLLVLNAVGDLFQIQPAVEPSTRHDWDKMSPEEFASTLFSLETCSGLIKVDANLTNLFMGHSSFFTYQNMIRIYKHYNFPMLSFKPAATRVSFSSYPGYLESLDDFYLMDSGLGMVQTSNNIFNNSLLDLIKPESLLAWQRVRIATALAHTGEEWANYFKRQASGTYVNQYMVVDFKLFKPGQPLSKNLLWVIEEIPGLIQSKDMTGTLERGYWPSYNKPFFPEIYSRSGYPEQVKIHGAEYSYDLAPRANIFRRDQSKVVDLESMKSIMRSNNYQTDPLSLGKASNAICARGDLNNPPSAGGCYDTKVTMYEMAMELQSVAVNGPTTENQPPFSWDDPSVKGKGISHVGQPTTFDFDFVVMTPLKNITSTSF